MGCYTVVHYSITSLGGVGGGGRGEESDKKIKGGACHTCQESNIYDESLRKVSKVLGKGLSANLRTSHLTCSSKQLYNSLAEVK